MNDKTSHSRQESLPRRVAAPSWLLKNIAELSKTSRKIHTVLVGFLVYCAVTIVTADDRKLIINDKAHLPIVNLDVPLSIFVVVAPIVSILAFIYFQLHVQALRSTIKILRTRHGPIERERLYPWMISMAEDPEPGLLGKIQKVLAQTSMWLLLPIVLFLFECFALKKHDVQLAFGGWLILAMGLCLVFWLWFRYEDTPRSSSKKDSRLDKWLQILIQHRVKSLLAALSFILLVMLLLLVPNENKARLGLFNADLSGVNFVKDLAVEPEGHWNNLRGLHLEGANLNYATLARGNLEGIQLPAGSLQYAHLEETYLTVANIRNGVLAGAFLRDAHLDGANLSQANLSCADLSGADFHETNLSGSFLIGANLEKAKNLTPDQLLVVSTLYDAKLDAELYQAINAVRPDLLSMPKILMESNDLKPDCENLVKPSDPTRDRDLADAIEDKRVGTRVTHIDTKIGNLGFAVLLIESEGQRYFAQVERKSKTTLSTSDGQTTTEVTYYGFLRKVIVVPCWGTDANDKGGQSVVWTCPRMN